MILTPRIGIRLALLAFFTVLIQVSFLAQMTPLGSSPDGALLVVMALGLLGGSLAGALSGFTGGLLIDLIAFQTLGASSLALMAVGYLAGRYRENFGRPTPPALALLGMALTMLGAVTYGAIQIGLGIDTNVSSLVVRDAFVKALLGGIGAVPVFVVVRLLLRPALIDDRPSARRPARARPSVRSRLGSLRSRRLRFATRIEH